MSSHKCDIRLPWNIGVAVLLSLAALGVVGLMMSSSHGVSSKPTLDRDTSSKFVQTENVEEKEFAAFRRSIPKQPVMFDEWLQEWGASIMRKVTTTQLKQGSKLEGHTWNFDKALGYTRRPQLARYYEEVQRRKSSINSVCEVGFNGAHSAMMFASILEGNASFLYFDLCQQSRCTVGKDILHKIYPNLSITIVQGNSKLTIPRYFQNNPDTRCDLISIDGGHFDDIPERDIKNMHQYAHKSTLVLIDDVGPKSDRDWEVVVGEAWQNAINNGTIVQDGECQRCSIFKGPEEANHCHFCMGRYVTN